MKQVTIDRDDLVVLLRIACDDSAMPLTQNEVDFLHRMTKQAKITKRDGVEVPL